MEHELLTVASVGKKSLTVGKSSENHIVTLRPCIIQLTHVDVSECLLENKIKDENCSNVQIGGTNVILKPLNSQAESQDTKFDIADNHTKHLSQMLSSQAQNQNLQLDKTRHASLDSLKQKQDTHSINTCAKQRQKSAELKSTRVSSRGHVRLCRNKQISYVDASDFENEDSDVEYDKSNRTASHTSKVKPELRCKFNSDKSNKAFSDVRNNEKIFSESQNKDKNQSEEYDCEDNQHSNKRPTNNFNKRKLSEEVDGDMYSKNIPVVAMEHHLYAKEYHLYAKDVQDGHACNECGKNFKTQRKLKKHKFTHSNDKPYSCEECGWAFKTLSSLSVHKKLHSKISKNHLKPQSSKDKDRLCGNYPDGTKIETVYSRDEQSPQIPECIKKINSLIEWNALLRCPSCQKIFIEKCDLRKHILRSFNCRGTFIHSDPDSKQITWQCKPCGYKCKNNERLTHHLIHDGPHCQWGYLTFPKRYELLSSDDTEFCSKYTLYFDCLRRKWFGEQERKGDGKTDNRHDKEANTVPSDDFIREIEQSKFCDVDFAFRVGFFCKQCKSVKRDKRDASRHVRDKHTSDNILNNHCTCSVCSKTSTDILQGNGKVHSENKVQCENILTKDKFLCDICGLLFTTNTNLKRHMDSVSHVGEKRSILYKYSCKFCGKRFSKKCSRDDHHTIHTNTKSHICEICGSAFKTKSQFSRHRIFNHNIINKIYRCSKCGKTFKWQSAFFFHQKSHKERQYKCDVCGKKFILKHHLNTHMVSHTKDRPFKCSLCGFEFTLKHHLQSHMKTKHDAVVHLRTKKRL